MGISTAVEGKYIAQQVRAFQQGDKGAYGRLFSLTKDLVFGYIYLQLGDRYTAEDIVMEAYTVGMEQLKNLRDPNAFNKWITEIAKSKLIDYTRAEKRAHSAIPVGDSRLEFRDGGYSEGIIDPFADYVVELRADIAKIVCSLEKEYLAVVHGYPPERGELHDLLWRDKARKMTFVADSVGKGVQEASLDYELRARGEGMSLVRIRLHTGRTHQIRVQFASRGWALFGERKYCEEPDECPLALWSHAVGFDHPETGERLRFAKEPPALWPWTDCEEIDS